MYASSNRKVPYASCEKYPEIIATTTNSARPPNEMIAVLKDQLSGACCMNAINAPAAPPFNKRSERSASMEIRTSCERLAKNQAFRLPASRSFRVVLSRAGRASLPGQAAWRNSVRTTLKSRISLKRSVRTVSKNPNQPSSCTARRSEIGEGRHSRRQTELLPDRGVLSAIRAILV